MRKIVIIKLGAKGDVVRTLPIVRSIKDKYKDSKIKWITKDNVKEILSGIQYIDQLFTVPFESKEEFDILYNFDIDEYATALANKIKAKEKFGFFSEAGYPAAYNVGAEYYLNTLFDDELKKTNTKTYQEMMFMAAELPNNKELAEMVLNKKDVEYAEEFVKTNNIQKENLLGIHLGASPRWPSKVWHEERIKEFIKKAREKNHDILIFGGPDETEKHKKFVRALEKDGVSVCRNNPKNTGGQFIALVNLCRAIICSDSFPLHVSIALKKPTIGLFFCTSPNEVESYGFLTKVVSPILHDFFPEKMDQYSEELTKSITAEEVLFALEAGICQTEKLSD
ncbi:MAG: glycosyltransferase family 9 protein [Nanoarchaeota archaeon]|nr:glycosyltransferase family 9 protein [Nanoarchaeota archaeon]MBU1103998.1 glycosyltransferase family 9 protein [Nanoarchaeota archaeon]